MKNFLTLSFLLVAFGCSQHPARLANEIASADRIVGTNIGTGATFSMKTDEVKRVVHAIAAAERDRKRYLATFSWKLQFYSGTNLLGSVDVQDRLFRWKGTQYRDDTGVLKSFYETRLREVGVLPVK